MTEQDIAALSADMWTRVRAIAQEEAAAIVEARLANLRPGGAHPLEVIIPGPAPSLTTEVAHIPVPYPALVTGLRLYTDLSSLTPTGTVTVDIRVQRPVQAGSAPGTPESIFTDLLYPGLIDDERQAFFPADPTTWAVNLEAGATVCYYVRTLTGNVPLLSIALMVRAL